ncbi:MAG: PTS sugar transporter subunit IIA [Deltaproteobacteria bacterium]|nr:MAG: PTS sugar transporter subunit IIA [Deltaproteobacteria bacterium]RLA98545.1 MAG: PTS sugar transporter subunit IIA [Deltaproteobacteria bacterium]
MKIVEILDEGAIVEEISSRDKKGVLEELVGVLVKEGRVPDGKEAIQVLLEREKLGSTGIGEGIAIPHGKLPDLKNVVCAFGRSRPGIDFEAVDNRPVHLFFLLLAPENSAGEHLKALARISRLLKDNHFRQRLLEAKDKKEIYEIIVEEDEKY